MLFREGKAKRNRKKDGSEMEFCDQSYLFLFFFWRISVIATREIRVDCLIKTKTSSIFGGLVLLLKLSLLKKKTNKKYENRTASDQIELEQSLRV